MPQDSKTIVGIEAEAGVRTVLFNVWTDGSYIRQCHRFFALDLVKPPQIEYQFALPTQQPHDGRGESEVHGTYEARRKLDFPWRLYHGLSLIHISEPTRPY